MTTRRQLRLAVRQAYYDLLAAQDGSAASKETAVFETTLAAAQKRKRRATSPAPTSHAYAVEALHARNDVRQPRSTCRKAQLALAQLLGVRPTAEAMRPPTPGPRPGRPSWAPTSNG